MGVRKNVFGSKSEQRYFHKLRRTWGSKYTIYHNLPFLNVFDTENLFDWWTDDRNIRPITLTEQEKARLKKTSIDYTLCDEYDAPILCIEFDGVQNGFNVGADYYPGDGIGAYNPLRQEFIELKLKVALASLFPYFVLGYTYFNDISAELKLAIVDGIIGEVLARRAVRSRLDKGFSPEGVGYTQEAFDSLSVWEQEFIVEDWLTDIEVGADMEHNPIYRKFAEELTQMVIAGSDISYTVTPLHHPPNETPDYWIREGARFTLHTSEYGDIVEEVWIPNLSPSGYIVGLNLCENIAGLLALEKLRRMQGSNKRTS